MTSSPITRHTLTSVCCIVFAFFGVSASGVFGDPDVPLLVLVGLVALAVFSTLAAKRWHLGLTTPIGAARQLDASDARDLMRMDSDKG